MTGDLDLALLFAVVTFMSLQLWGGAWFLSRMKTNLDNLTKDIESLIRRMDRTELLRERLVAVEGAAASAHKRLDRLEGKLENRLK